MKLIKMALKQPCSIKGCTFNSDWLEQTSLGDLGYCTGHMVGRILLQVDLHATLVAKEVLR